MGFLIVMRRMMVVLLLRRRMGVLRFLGCRRRIVLSFLRVVLTLPGSALVGGGGLLDVAISGSNEVIRMPVGDYTVRAVSLSTSCSGIRTFRVERLDPVYPVVDVGLVVVGNNSVCEGSVLESTGVDRCECCGEYGRCCWSLFV